MAAFFDISRQIVVYTASVRTVNASKGVSRSPSDDVVQGRKGLAGWTSRRYSGA